MKKAPKWQRRGPRPEDARRGRQVHWRGYARSESGRSQNWRTSTSSSPPEYSAKFGKIDALFANAGIAKFAPAGDSNEQLFDESFDVNVKGLYFTLQKALSHLNDNAGIVLNSSVVNSKGSANTSVYSATKAAVRSLARTFASELVDRGIRVNVVNPGPITTPIFGRTGLPQAAVDEFANHVEEQVPMKRFGTPEEGRPRRPIPCQSRGFLPHGSGPQRRWRNGPGLISFDPKILEPSAKSWRLSFVNPARTGRARLQPCCVRAAAKEIPASAAEELPDHSDLDGTMLHAFPSHRQPTLRPSR